MQRGFQASIEIARPLPEVWRLITDFSRAGEWMPGIERLAPLDGGPAAGARYEIAFATSGRGKLGITTLSEWEPEATSFAFTTSQSGMTTHYRYNLSPAPSGTRVTLDATCESRGPMMRLMHPLLAWLMERHDGRQMPLLKRFVEDGA